MEAIISLASFAPAGADVVVYDVDAHHGQSVAQMLDLMPAATIHAFEPQKENFSALSQRHGDDARVRLHNLAIADRDGFHSLRVNNYDGTHSLFDIDEAVINRWADDPDFVTLAEERVPLRSVDSIVAAGDAPAPDLIKIDTQGAELLAFRGAERTLRDQRVRAIVCEVEFVKLYKDQPLFFDIHDWMSHVGYHFVNLVDRKIRPNGVMVWADALYCNEEAWAGLSWRG